MTDTTATPPAARFRLGTLGTLALTGPDGETVLGKHGHHRRRLALLAVLAAAGDQGRGRDQLLLLFWPDATQSRARHSLDQLLYALRASVGEAAFTSGNPVTLDPRVLASDVGAFNAALQRGDLEAAVDEYRGPFLDGLYLNDAPEFERWMESERARLATAYADALTRLAQRAEGAHDHPTAVRRWRKLVELDPVSGSNAAGLIRALMNAGDHTAALQYAERYEALVAQELGTSVGPAVAGLVAEVRAEIRTESVSSKGAHGVTAEKPSAGQPPSEATTARPVIPPAIPPAIPRDAPARRRFAPLLIGVFVVALIAVAAAAGFYATRSAGSTPPDAKPSIAVLPFANTGGDPRDAAIVDGFTEALTGALATIENLRTIASTSAFAFRNSDAGARRIGDSLGVGHVVEGSVQRSGSRLRVHVRLVETRTATTRWSAKYDREIGDIFAVQSEIATAVARELDLRLASSAIQRVKRGPTSNIAAYDLYYRGASPLYQRPGSDGREGLALLQQAVALDSTFAAAYASMPYRYFRLVGTAANRDSLRLYRRLALAAAQKAIALDPSLPEAYMGLSVAYGMSSSHFGESERALRRAIELGAPPRAHEHLSRVLMWSGRPEESLAEALLAAAGDPLSATAAADVGEGLCANGRIDEGLAQLRPLSSVKPPLGRLPIYYGLCYAMKGAWTEVIGLVRGGEVPRASVLYGYALGRGGDRSELARVHNEWRERWRTTRTDAINVAAIAAGLGDHDQAFVWLDRAIADESVNGAIMYPLFADLHADPRFQRVRDHFGIQKR